MNYTGEQLQSLLPCKASKLHSPQAVVTTVVFDSRQVLENDKSIFVAIKTEKNDGHFFIDEVYKKGVRNFIVESPEKAEQFSDVNFFVVENSIEALQQLAAYHRKQFTGPVIAITGSNGKTIVKEWLYKLLRDDFNIHRSPRSFNSQLGVAVSLLGIESWHTLAIIEAGISKQGEMEKLHKMIAPSLGIVTNIGSAHDEGFLSKEEKAAEKSQLLQNADVAIVCADEEMLQKPVTELRNKYPLTQWITWGYNEHSKYKIAEVNTENNESQITLVYRTQPISYTIPFADKASVYNSVTCIAVLHALERLDREHLDKFKQLTSVQNRLTFTTGTDGNFIVDDSYSNDPESLQIALDFCIRQQPVMKHIVILSDFEQGNRNKAALYERINGLLLAKKIEGLIIVGPEITFYKQAFTVPLLGVYENTTALLNHIPDLGIANATILIKGARSYGFERIKQKLEQKEHETILEIDLDALKHNYLYFKSLLKKGTRVMPMVKAFGYGSGTFEAAKLLESLGCDYFAVAYLDEGIQLRNAGIKTSIMVLNSNVSQLESMLKYRLEPVIYSKKQYLEINRKAAGESIRAHIEIDSGMHRLGFEVGEIAVFIEKEKPLFEIVSVFSHLAASEAPEHDAFTQKQIESFKNAALEIEKTIGKRVIKHIANTGGILRFPEAHLDMVRLGIGLYGVDPGDHLTRALKPVTCLKTVISQIKTILPGESIGYSRKALSDQQRRIAILPIGYADGLWRAMGNGNGSVFINGKRAAFVGNVCMDMCMVELGNIECAEGDEVEIFGHHISVYEVAAICNTIPYETLTSISQRVKRVFVGES